MHTKYDWLAWRAACDATRLGELPPSPDDIAAGCLEVQRRWSDAERDSRSTHYAAGRRRGTLADLRRPYETPLIRVDHLGHAAH